MSNSSASPTLLPIDSKSKPPAGPSVRLTEIDAIDIWIARWLGIRRKDILARYGCDPRRLYDIWEESRFPGSRGKALALFAERYPKLVAQVDTSAHRRIPRPGPGEDQLGLFDAVS